MEQNSNKSKKQTRQKSSPQFKEQALERAKQSGVRQAVIDLGISEVLLYNWRSKKADTGLPFEQQKLQQAEFARMKRELARLEMENAFLKKAAAYFAKGQE